METESFESINHPDENARVRKCGGIEADGCTWAEEPEPKPEPEPEPKKKRTRKKASKKAAAKKTATAAAEE